jgi:hypothetical protein
MSVWTVSLLAVWGMEGVGQYGVYSVQSRLERWKTYIGRHQHSMKYAIPKCQSESVAEQPPFVGLSINHIITATIECIGMTEA